MAKKNDTFFFDNYRACADRSCKAAEFLANIMGSFNPSEIRGKLDEMHAIEQSADELRHQMSDALVKAFITPMEREDMGVLSNQLDAVTDHLEAVLHCLYYDNILEIRPDALQMVDTVVRGCKEMRALMDELPQFKKSKTLQQRVIAINSIEEEADDLYVHAMRELLTTCSDPLQVIAWRDVYTFLELCADSLEHVAETVATIAMKNS